MATISESLEPTFTGLKKKQVEAEPLEEDKENIGEDLDHPTGSDEQGEGIVLEEQMLPGEGTDRGYEYEELLGRVFHILRENNPELAGDRRRIVMRPPQVLREGTKKTLCGFYGPMQIHAQTAGSCYDVFASRVGYKWFT